MSNVLSTTMENLIPERSGSGSYSQRDSKLVTNYTEGQIPIKNVPSGDAGDVLNHNPCPPFTKPRSTGSESLPEVFFDERPGYSGEAPIVTTMTDPIQVKIK